MNIRSTQLILIAFLCATVGLSGQVFAGELKASTETEGASRDAFIVGPHSEAEQKLATTLRETVVESVEFVDTTLAESLQQIADTHDIQTIFDLRSLDEEDVSSMDEKLTLALNNIRLTTLLEHVLRPYDLEYITEDGILVVTTQSVARERLKTIVYDVSSLEERGWEADMLVRLLLNAHIPNASWTPDDPDKRASAAQGTLIVTQSQPAHRRIHQFLETLSRAPKQDARKARKATKRQRKRNNFHLRGGSVQGHGEFGKGGSFRRNGSSGGGAGVF